MTTWTPRTKASGTSWTQVAKIPTAITTLGSPIGLLLTLTYPQTQGTAWSNVTKATGTVWTPVPKAT